MINYAAFIQSVNQVFTDQANPSALIQNVKSHAVFTEQEQHMMMDAVTQMNNKIKAERILLKPSFMDFDRSQQLHITSH
jgi:Ca2+-binding EF-hand superfamily protein